MFLAGRRDVIKDWLLVSNASAVRFFEEVLPEGIEVLGKVYATPEVW